MKTRFKFRKPNYRQRIVIALLVGSTALAASFQNCTLVTDSSRGTLSTEEVFTFDPYPNLPPTSVQFVEGSEQPLNSEARKEWYEVEDDPQKLFLMKADMYAVNSGFKPDTSSDHHTITVHSWLKLAWRDLCEDNPFLGQPAMKDGASAILVGEDLAITAQHTMSSQSVCNNKKFVFDHGLKFQDDPLNFHPETEELEVLKSKTYACDTIIALGNDSGTGDWVLFTLDRPVERSERTPLKIRRRGRIQVGEGIINVGHPQRLPIKVQESKVSHSFWDEFKSIMHVAIGASGSMVVNQNTGYLEGHVRSGTDRSIVRESGCSFPDYLTKEAKFWPVNRAAWKVPKIGLEVNTDPSISDPLSSDLIIKHKGKQGSSLSNSTGSYILNNRNEVGGRKVEFKITGDTEYIDLINHELNITTDLDENSEYIVDYKLKEEVTSHFPKGTYFVKFEIHDLTYKTIDNVIHQFIIE